MRKMLAGVMALALVLLCGINKEADASSIIRRANGSTQARPTGLPFLASVNMFSAQAGYAVESSLLHILVTKDGGRQWRDVTPSGYTITPAESPLVPSLYDGLIGWIGSVTGRGVWVLGHAPSPHLLFYSDRTGKWAARTMPPLLVSETEWMAAPPPEVEFINQDVGWLLGYICNEASPSSTCSHSKVQLFRTVDGARTWHLVVAVGGSPVSSRGQGPSGTATRMYFVNGKTGWLTGESTHSVWLYATNNGGASWQNERIASLESRYWQSATSLPMQFDGPTHGLLPVVLIHRGADKQALSEEFIVYVTSDSGVRWRRHGSVNVMTSFGAWPVWSASPSLTHIWVANIGCDCIDVTSNTGRSWRQVSPPFAVPLLGELAFVNNLDGWAVLNMQTGPPSLYVTRNGGISWSLVHSRVS